MKDVQNPALIEEKKVKRQKYGGRTKGSVNKKTQSLVEELERLNFNVVERKAWTFAYAQRKLKEIEDNKSANEKTLREHAEALAAWSVACDKWSREYKDWVNDNQGLPPLQKSPEPERPDRPICPPLIEVETDRVGLLGVCDSVTKDLMKYIFPQRKAVEHTGANDEPLMNSFSDMVKGLVHAELESTRKT